MDTDIIGDDMSPTFRDSQTAFNDAIRAGRLSTYPGERNYAGDYMYMGDWAENGTIVAKFKNIDTRRYDV